MRHKLVKKLSKMGKFELLNFADVELKNVS